MKDALRPLLIVPPVIGMFLTGACSESHSAPTLSPTPAEVEMTRATINGKPIYGLRTGCDPWGNRIYWYSSGPGNPTISALRDPSCAVTR